MKIIVDNNRKTKLISEIGCNHRGEFETALRMISVSSEYSDIIKFQKRNPKTLLSETEYNNPHPNPYHSYGSTYGEHREHLEFTLSQHNELKKYCEKLNRSYSCSVWDTDSAKDISSINIDIIKIPSACNLNKDLLECVFKLHSKEIHISLGMTKRRDINKIIDFAESFNRNKDIVLYVCTSSYPSNSEDLYLKEIEFLKNTYGDKIKSIGFSGHHTSIIPDVAAIALGVKYIERHFTLNKSWKGTDHRASLEIDELRNLMRNIVEVEKSLKHKPDSILKIEEKDYKKLKRIQTL